ncbi:MAG: hypothetical protein ACHQ15_08185, partial [Candidatus Limnocylindrales bacterium]
VAPYHLRFGLPYLLALGWWLLGRFLVGFFWRDDLALGPLRVEQALALASLVALVLILLEATRRPPEIRVPLRVYHPRV